MKVTDHLFETKFMNGFDLIAINIQRAREHGIPGYVQYKKACDLGNPKTFSDLANHISQEVRKT